MWSWTIHFTSLNCLSHEMKILIWCLIRLFRRLYTRASRSHSWTVKQQLHYSVYMLFHTFSLYTSALWPWSLWGWCQALPPELVVVQLIDPTRIMPWKLRYSLMVLEVPSQVALMVKNLSAMQEMQETQVWSMGQEDPLEEEMATHSSILAWEIPWTEEPDEL